MKNKILEVLKANEQQDYKNGGVSIPPENYEAIANTLISDIRNNLSPMSNLLEMLKLVNGISNPIIDAEIKNSNNSIEYLSAKTKKSCKRPTRNLSGDYCKDMSQCRNCLHFRE